MRNPSTTRPTLPGSSFGDATPVPVHNAIDYEPRAGERVSCRPVRAGRSLAINSQCASWQQLKPRHQARLPTNDPNLYQTRIQNTAARRLAVPDLTTTVLTMTLTGIAADSGRSSGLTTTRRAFAVLTMLLGAAVGALLVLHSGLASALGVALFLLGLVVAVAASRSRRTARWQTYHLTS